MLLRMKANGPTLHEGGQVIAPGGDPVQIDDQRAKTLLELIPELEAVQAVPAAASNQPAAGNKPAEANAKAKK